VVGTASGADRIGALFDGLMSRLDELNTEYATEELAVIADYQRRAAVIQAAESQALADIEPQQRR
jgi:hypothetical protein